MNLTLKIFSAIVLIAAVSLYATENGLNYVEEPVAYREHLTDSVQEKLSFIGEVKGKSYIKIILFPVEVLSVFDIENTSALKYKGSYYESISGRKFVLTAEFSPESRTWTFRCFNSNNQPVFIFSGKQNADGVIDGVWKSKKSVHPFYLRPA